MAKQIDPIRRLCVITKQIDPSKTDEKQWGHLSTYYKAGQEKSDCEESPDISDVKKANSSNKELKTFCEQDLEVTKNAFNQKDNPDYYYQATDITIIQAQIMQKYSADFIIHEPIGNNHALQPTLKKLIDSLDKLKPTLCIYNLGNYHWVTFAALKTDDGITILYKDSFGWTNPSFEKEIKNIDGIAQVVAHRGYDQTRGIDCGIFAIENMQIMAKALLKDKEGFIDKFISFSGFCSLDKANELRHRVFAEEFVLGKEREMNDELVKISKLMQLRSQHETEINSLAATLQEQNLKFFRKFNIKSFDDKLESDSNTIYLDIATSPETDLKSSNYVYYYRISLSKDLKADSKEIAENINSAFNITVRENAKLADFNEELAMLVNEDQINIINKNPKQALTEGALPRVKVKIEDLIDNLNLGANQSLKGEVQLIVSLKDSLSEDFTTNIRNIIQEYTSLNLAVPGLELTIPIIEEILIPDTAEKKLASLKQIKEFFELGQKYFKQGNFKEAEKELVKVIKPVLSKSGMKDLYVNVEDVKKEALEAMYHLGRIYLSDASYFNYHAKATGIFQYCGAFAKKYRIGDAEFYLKQAHDVEAEFLKDVKAERGIAENSRESIDLYKEELENFRKDIKDRLESIKDLTIDKIGIRANIIEKIYDDCSNFFVNHAQDKNNNQLIESQGGLLQRLLSDCYKQLGNPPAGCEHAIIALGSLALGTMTPWSDLEFAILVNRSEYKEYFRNLTKLLQIKVINLGETHLKGLGVESLNNFKTGEAKDEWFWDDVVKIKFNFDSARWDACKVPLGRQGKHKVIEKVKNKKTGKDEKITLIKRDYELILTPDEMAAFQKEIPKRIDNEEHKGITSTKENKNIASGSDLVLERETAEEIVKTTTAGTSTIRRSWFESDKHLVQALRSVSLIDGSQELLDEYRLKVVQVERPEILQERTLQILKENIDQFALKIGDKEEGRLIDSKMHIYRLGDRVINGLSNYYNITAGVGFPKLTVWQMIEKLRQEEIFSPKGAQHLKEAVTIATELRLSAYSYNDTRSESVSTYVPAVEHLAKEDRNRLIEETFHMDNVESLYHFYYVMLRVQTIIKIFCDKESQTSTETFNDDLFDDSNYNRGMVHARFLEYDKALKYMQTAKKEQPKNLKLLQDLLFLYNKTGTVDGTITIAKEMLELDQNDHQNDSNHLSIASSYNNLGAAYASKGEYDQAIENHQQALKIMLKIHKSSPNHSDIGSSYNNLGAAYQSKGEYDQAIENLQKALKIKLKVHKSSPNHPSIAKSYNNLGNAYYIKGEYDQAIENHKQALKIKLKVYESSPNHPEIAKSYGNLGNTYYIKGEYGQAIGNHQRALKIMLKVYESSPNHPDISSSYNGLSNAYQGKREYDKAIEYCSKALKILFKVYENSPNHPEIAVIYNNLGGNYHSKGEYDKAIENHQKALKIKLKAYESNSNHPDIASSYNNLGAAYASKGEYDQAIENHQQALKILLKVHKSSPNHPDIAASYNNLVIAYRSKGEYDKAIENHQKALKIMLKAYESSPNHPSIAKSYSNLGSTYASKGEYDQACFYAKKAFDIFFQHQNQQHINIAKNLYDKSFTKLYNIILVAYKVGIAANNNAENFESKAFSPEENITMHVAGNIASYNPDDVD